jgi:hypothetical protein
VAPKKNRVNPLTHLMECGIILAAAQDARKRIPAFLSDAGLHGSPRRAGRQISSQERVAFRSRVPQLRDAGASRPGPSEVEGTWHPDGGPSGRGGWPAQGRRRDAGASRTWHPDGGPSGRGGRARGRPFPLAAVGGRNMRCAKGGGVGVRPEGGAPPGVEGQRLCGLLKTLSRIASNRQTAARETVESAQH